MLTVFTIVLNGMPWIPVIYERLKQVQGVEWNWIIVYGYSDPVKCTSWCKGLDINDPLRKSQTTEDWLRSINDKRVKVIFPICEWNGKVQMCNTALEQIKEPCVLMQMDADELWEPWQIKSVYECIKMQDEHGMRFFCNYFITPYHFLNTPGRYGNQYNYEWDRAWPYKTGMTFESHEPPRLNGIKGMFPNMYSNNMGLYFNHMAYATEDQVRFKCRYYGYDEEKSIDGWHRLCANKEPKVWVDAYLPWIKDVEATRV